MAGALTLFLLMAVSMTIVRAAGVALRLTGVPQSVARFQAISALTGAGYTTIEAEALMRHPIRRRILMILMLTGHLGLVSLASTVILAVTAAEGAGGAAVQIVALLCAVGAIYALAASATLDRLLCTLIQRMMSRWHWLDPTRKSTIYVHEDGQELTEHLVEVETVLDPGGAPVIVLTQCGTARDVAAAPVTLQPGDKVLCFGSSQDHDRFAAMLNRPDPAPGDSPHLPTR